MSAPSPEAVVGEALTAGFFGRPTDVVARDLIGCLLVRTSDDGDCVGRIVETEAYGGPEDHASHARAGLTRRTAPMFGPPGRAYVYLVYGMHECLNVVAYARAVAGAVLIRGIEPLDGIELMRARRGRPNDPVARLCAGPARLCQAFAVDRSFDAHDLTSGERLWLAIAAAPFGGVIASGPRVGVGYAGDGWAEREWRFWATAHPSVSR